MELAGEFIISRAARTKHIIMSGLQGKSILLFTAKRRLKWADSFHPFEGLLGLSYRKKRPLNASRFAYFIIQSTMQPHFVEFFLRSLLGIVGVVRENVST